MALLEIKNITKSFDNNTILKNVSLNVKKGEVIVILGPSGCGKSTFLRCINGLEKIQQGEILLDGEVISNRTKDMHLIRQKIGMVFQSYDLFPHLNVMKNILLGPKEKAFTDVRWTETASCHSAHALYASRSNAF